MILVTSNWFQTVDRKAIFEKDGDHDDELETSLMMYLFPELVLPLEEAGKGSSKLLSVDSLNENWAWTERKWTRVSKDTGIGDPSKANKEKGEKYFRLACEKLYGLMVELCTVDKDSFYR